jgi:hypothetical protein
MALQPTKTLRINGKLVQSTEEELRNLAKKQGTPGVPITPAGAAASGASPDAAKMAGSRQQKEAAPTAVKVQTDKSLAGTQRLDQGREVATGAEQAQAAKAGKLQQLSGVDERVQALVNQQLSAGNLQASAAAQTAYNDAQLATLAPTVDQAGVKTLLDKYHQLNLELQSPALDPTARQAKQAELNQALADLTNQYGINNPQAYLDVSQTRVGSTAAQSVINPADVKLSTLDVSPLGLSQAELTDLLGPDWADLSVGQFQQRVNDVRQAEFQRINTLRGQLVTLPVGSAQRELVLRELGDSANVGVTGVEQGIKQLQQQLDEASVVKVGGVDYTVENLLKDETISRLVADYLNPAGDPEDKAALEQGNPDLVAWIKGNSQALTDLAKQMGVSDAGFGTVQEGQKALATVGEGATLSDAVMKNLVPEWGSAVASVTDLSDNGLYAALKDPSVTTDDRADLAAKLNADPELVQTLAGLPAEQVLAADKAADAVSNDDVLAKVLGFDDPTKIPKFLTDADAQKTIARVQPLIEKLRTDSSWAAKLEEPEMQELLRKGELTAKNIAALMDNPQSYQDYKEYQGYLKDFAAVENAKNPDRLLQFMFGDSDVSKKSLEKLYKDLSQINYLDPSDRDTANRLKSLKDILGDDGKLSAVEAVSLSGRIKAALGEGIGLRHILKGEKKKNFDFTLRDKFNESTKPKYPAGTTDDPKKDAANKSFRERILAVVKDKKITFDELAAMSHEDRTRIFNNPAFKDLFEASASSKEMFDLHYNTKLDKDAWNTVKQTLSEMRIVPGGGVPDGPTLGALMASGEAGLEAANTFFDTLIRMAEAEPNLDKRNALLAKVKSIRKNARAEFDKIDAKRKEEEKAAIEKERKRLETNLARATFKTVERAKRELDEFNARHPK